MPEFRLESQYSPAGDQPQAIDKLVEGVRAGAREQTLMGVTGSGKTFTVANVIQEIHRSRRRSPVRVADEAGLFDMALAHESADYHQS